MNPRILPTSDKINPTQRKSIGAGPYVNRNRDKGEALPNVINVMTQPRYVPAKHLSTRQGIAQ